MPSLTSFIIYHVLYKSVSEGKEVPIFIVFQSQRRDINKYVNNNMHTHGNKMWYVARKHVLISHMYVWYSVANRVTVTWFSCKPFILLIYGGLREEPMAFGFCFKGN